MIKLAACTKSIMNRTPLDYLAEQIAIGTLPPLLINDGQITGVEDDNFPAAGTAGKPK